MKANNLIQPLGGATWHFKTSSGTTWHFKQMIVVKYIFFKDTTKMVCDFCKSYLDGFRNKKPKSENVDSILSHPNRCFFKDLSNFWMVHVHSSSHRKYWVGHV
jgi:hypothetical protein